MIIRKMYNVRFFRIKIFNTFDHPTFIGFSQYFYHLTGALAYSIDRVVVIYICIFSVLLQKFAFEEALRSYFIIKNMWYNMK